MKGHGSNVRVWVCFTFSYSFRLFSSAIFLLVRGVVHGVQRR